MKFSVLDAKRYYEQRLARNRMHGRGDAFTAQCPFHDDRSPSLSINMAKNGAWKCHTGCGSGGMVEFEMKLNNCDEHTAIAEICKILGREPRFDYQKPSHVFQYTDEQRNLLFEVLRYENPDGKKRIVQRRPDGTGGWINALGETRRVLYHLPEVVRAAEVVVCEGEKKADRVRLEYQKATYPDMTVEDACLAGGFTATCNSGGAGKWKEEYSAYLTGKKVIVLRDEDENGRSHALAVARSVRKHAAGVRYPEWPEGALNPKDDVFDFLDKYGWDKLVALIRNTPPFKEAGEAQRPKLFMPGYKFTRLAPDRVDWMVQDVIERGSMGFICADPKSGKSWAACDLALALAFGQPWLDFHVPVRTRVAICSREDNPNTTSFRLRRLADHRGVNIPELDDWLYVNSRVSCPTLMLDNASEVSELIEDVKYMKAEFLILDVLNRMHTQEENDNTAMAEILRQIIFIQQETKCQIAIVHHFNKNGAGSNFIHRMRGAGAIAGSAEWAVGISVVDETLRVRKMEFENKAAAPVDSFYYKISDAPTGAAFLEKVQWQEGKGKTPGQLIFSGSENSESEI